MINVMQIIVSLPLLNLQFPANALLFYNFIVGIANFNIIPTDQLQALMFQITATSPGQRFQDMGYSTSNILQNLLNLIIILFIVIIAATFAIMIRFFKQRFPL